MKFGVIGLGVVGSCYRRWLSEHNWEVVGYDIKGEGSIEEVSTADTIFICVNTPYDVHADQYETKYVNASVEQIKGERKTIVVCSTVPVGTCVRLAAEYPQHTFLHNPEFLRAKTAWEDFCHPVRQVVGASSPRSTYKAQSLIGYLPDGHKSYFMHSDESELLKLSSNLLLAAQIAAKQVVMRLAVGSNSGKFAEILALDPRIGSYGFDQSQQCGYSGRCLPKDVRGFLHECKEAGVDAKWLMEMDAANEVLLRSQWIEPDYGYPLEVKEAVSE
jgi:UDPglucose 6-dehydrogenase